MRRGTDAARRGRRSCCDDRRTTHARTAAAAARRSRAVAAASLRRLDGRGAGDDRGGAGADAESAALVGAALRAQCRERARRPALLAPLAAAAAGRRRRAARAVRELAPDPDAARARGTCRRTSLPAVDSVASRRACDCANDWTSVARLVDGAQRAAERASRRSSKLAGDAARTWPTWTSSSCTTESRHLFAIGYNVSEHRLDASFYDLLASEARLASFVAIAQGQLPQEHWFALGRLLTTTGGEPALLSLERLDVRVPDAAAGHADLRRTRCSTRRTDAVGRRQIEYGQQRGVPWGISESGYNTIDAHLNYQYRAFGVPGLGFKRGLAEDLVIAPYATRAGADGRARGGVREPGAAGAPRAAGRLRLLRGDRLHAVAAAARARRAPSCARSWPTTRA